MRSRCTWESPPAWPTGALPGTNSPSSWRTTRWWTLWSCRITTTHSSTPTCSVASLEEPWRWWAHRHPLNAPSCVQVQGDSVDSWKCVCVCFRFRWPWMSNLFRTPWGGTTWQKSGWSSSSGSKKTSQPEMSDAPAEVVRFAEDQVTPWTFSHTDWKMSELTPPRWGA